jgi:hypothetical protein
MSARADAAVYHDGPGLATTAVSADVQTSGTTGAAAARGAAMARGGRPAHTRRRRQRRPPPPPPPVLAIPFVNPLLPPQPTPPPKKTPGTPDLLVMVRADTQRRGFPLRHNTPSAGVMAARLARRCRPGQGPLALGVRLQDSISMGHGPGGQPLDMDFAVARVRASGA